MGYTEDRLHPLDPGIGQLDRPQDQTIWHAARAILERRNRALRRRLAELRAEHGGGPDER